MSHFFTEPRNFEEVTRLPAYVKKALLKETLKENENLINNHTFLMDYSDKINPVTPCMDVYKAKIQYDGSFYKLKLRIVVIGYFHNKEIIGDTWYKTV